MFLVTVHDPVCTDSGDLEAALYGSFLPIPKEDAFPPVDVAESARDKLPGAVIVKDQRVVLNRGRERVKLRVTNNGDRPIQIGSHYHFIETNPLLTFDRARAYGKRLDIAAGTAVRFEPGDVKTVTLCAIGGGKVITGGNGLATGVFDPSRTDDIVAGLIQKGFQHVPEPGALEINEDTDIGREAYVAMFGPTVGDRVRLGDTELWIEVESDSVNQATSHVCVKILTGVIRPCMEMKSSSAEARRSEKEWVKPLTDPPLPPWTWSSPTLSSWTGLVYTR